MITAIRFVFLATLGSWIGIMAFLSFVVAPTVFGVLEAPQAGDVVGAIFPRYYAVGVSLGVAAVAAALFLRTRSERRRARTARVQARGRSERVRRNSPAATAATPRLTPVA